MADQIINITVNHTVREVAVNVTHPAPLEIDILAMHVDEPLFHAFKNTTFLTGVKKTGIDAGVMPSFSFTDDYLYILVQGGAPGEAIWKKAILFQT